MSRRGKRQMAFRAQQPRGRVEPDPARARQIGLGPGVKIDNILLGTLRPFERIDIGAKLDEIAGDEARRDAEPAEKLDQKPGRVAARSRAEGQRLLWLLHAGLHAHQVAHGTMHALIQLDEELDGRPPPLGERGEKGAELLARPYVA